METAKTHDPIHLSDTKSIDEWIIEIDPFYRDTAQIDVHGCLEVDE